MATAHPCTSKLRSTALAKPMRAAIRTSKPRAPPKRAALPPQAALGNGRRSLSGGRVSRPITETDRSAKDDTEIAYLKRRSSHVTSHFKQAIGVDDFIQRLEIALWGYGFQNDNSIAMVNLCRDEVTHTLKHKIDQVYGSSFSTSGLGGVLTCGVTGVSAGLSHSPVSEASGKERYVFFSFPHVGIDADGVVGSISRPGRSTTSCACGAVIKALGDIQRGGLTCSCRPAGVHDPLDPEYSILKQRLARRLEFEGQTEGSVGGLDLVDFTKVAERTITSDLEFLISKAVDTSRADYAVVTGVQIHNWGAIFDYDHPNLEFVAPTKVYVVVNGQKHNIDLSAMPALTPRQIRFLASAPDAHTPSRAHAEEAVCNSARHTTVREIDPPYMYSSRPARRRIKQRLASYAQFGSSAKHDEQLSAALAAAMKLAQAVRVPAGAK